MDTLYITEHLCWILGGRILNVKFLFAQFSAGILATRILATSNKKSLILICKTARTSGAFEVGEKKHVWISI